MGAFDYLFRTPKEENVKPGEFKRRKNAICWTYSDHQAAGGHRAPLAEANLQNPGKVAASAVMGPAARLKEIVK
jgi:hypothetical protein